MHATYAQERWYGLNIHLRGQVVADVGANVGRLSQFFWEASGGTARVVSIEPLRENVAAIRSRIQAANADGWTVHECAVSGRAGRVALAVAANDAGGLNGVVVARGGARRVRCVPLSQLVPDANVVKLDIEGHEYGVIAEAVPRLTQVHTWALELHQVPGQPLQPALGVLQAEGFRLWAATREADNENAWFGTEILATLDWNDIPAGVRPDGSAFRTLHVIAQRQGDA